MNKVLYIAFVNLKVTKFFEIMKNTGIDYNDRKIIYKLYLNETMIIKASENSQN